MALGEDVSEALGILNTRLNACLDAVKDIEVKKEILTAMKKAFGDSKNLETETVKHR